MGSQADSLIELIDRLGFSLWGGADISGLHALANTYPRAISLALAYKPDFDPYNEQRYHDLLHQVGNRFTSMIGQVLGFLKDENIPHKWVPHGGQNPDTLLATFPHKLAATRAGLGWIGKQSVLITPQYGPRMHLSTILLDLDIPVGEPISESRCGDCCLCVEACPYGYVNGATWYPGIDRAELFDAFSCSHTRASFIPDIGHKHECGLCLLTCPIGTKRMEE